MLYLKKWVRIVLFFMSLTAVALGAPDAKVYFQALKKIQRLPQGGRAIAPLNRAQTQSLIQLFKRQHVKVPYEPSKQDSLADQYGEAVTIYQGDFSNEGMTEYLFILTGGSLRVNTVMGVYQLRGNKIHQLDFQKVLEKNLSLKEAMSQFYLWVAKPFAYVSNGKTYLRFMTYPTGPGNYDIRELQVCTYLWTSEKFKLIGPRHCI